MQEVDLLIKISDMCSAYIYGTEPKNYYTKEEELQCLMYLAGKINKEQFDRYNKEQWEQAKRVLYARLEEKSPQSMFELTLGLPEGVSVVVLEEIVYGKMFFDQYRNVELKK
jgi:hypothetical protein